MRLTVNLDKTSAGGANQLTPIVRSTPDNSSYRATVLFSTSGSVSVSLVKVAGGASTTLRTVTVAGLTYSAGRIST